VKNVVRISQAVIQFFVGFTAAVSGSLLVISPSGELLRAPLEMLRGSPFRDFLIPGVILSLVNGIGQIAAAVLTLRRHRFAGYAGAVFGLGLMIWIFLQVSWIGGGHILQYSYFFLGVLETALAFVLQGHLSRMDG
jgi:hypothetical protein